MASLSIPNKLNIEHEEFLIEDLKELNQFLEINERDYVLIKYSADWCRPCQNIKAYVDELVRDKIEQLENSNTQHTLAFIKIDIDESFDLYAKLKRFGMVRSVPSIHLYKRDIYIQEEDKTKWYIPQGSYSGQDQNELSKLFSVIV